MPLIQKTIYIREGDIEKWKALPNKAEFIHNALNHDVLTHVQDMVNKYPVLQKHIDKQKLDTAVASEPLYRDKKNKL